MRRQRLPLDRWIGLSYIATSAWLAGCRGPLVPLVPMALAPANWEDAAAWARATLPARHSAIRLRWKYRDDVKQWGGRGQARIAPPDSLRFDYVGPLGLGAGAAAVVSDSAIWADPEKNFRSLVPVVRVLWAGLGMVQPPAANAAVSALQGSAADTGVQIWRFVQGQDTLDYRVSVGATRVLESEWRQQGKVQARSRTQFNGHAMPASARIDFPEGRARLEFTIVSIDTAAAFDPAIWRGRR